MTIARHSPIAAQAHERRRMTRRHRLILLLAFEILIYGAAQSVFQPIRRPGISVETTVTPNHAVT